MQLNDSSYPEIRSYQGQFPSPAFPQSFNPYPLAVQPVVPVIPPEVLGYLKASSDQALCLAVENEQLKQQQNTKILREDAYTKVFNDGLRATWTMTESGRCVELLDAALTSAFRLVPHGPENHPVTFGLEFTGRAGFILLDESTYLDDKLLIHNLQTAGIRVMCRRSTRTTATLIRQSISANLTTINIDFYGGWKQQDQGPVFLWFQGLSSHQVQTYMDVARPTGELSPAVASIAAAQLAKTFQAIRSPVLHWLLSAWFHASFLYSLLEVAESALPMGLCLYTQEPMIHRWLEQLLCWYGDPPINLDDRSATFNRAIWNRKDQPAVIIDHHQTDNARHNASLLEEILATKMILWKDRSKEVMIPLHASIVVLCDTISSLCCSPKLFTLDLQAEDFDLELCGQQFEQAPVQQDYLQALASYTAMHWSELQEALRQGRTHAASFAVNTDALDEAGTLLGAASFADAFCRFCGVEDAAVSLSGNVTAEALREIFTQMSSDGSGIDVPRQFCQLAQRCMAGGIFFICDAAHDDSDGSKPVVYLIGDDYGFTSEAFRTVCRRMSQSTPVIAQALSEARLLRGKHTNATTVQTRIPVTRANGNCRYVGVYRIAQEDIQIEAF